jgi:hypothetical protein
MGKPLIFSPSFASGCLRFGAALNHRPSTSFLRLTTPAEAAEAALCESGAKRRSWQCSVFSFQPENRRRDAASTLNL